MQKNMWGKVLTKLEKRINRPSFNTWLKPTSFLAVDQKNIHIGVPNDVFVYWLGEHYVKVISEALAEVLGFQPVISFVVVDAADETVVDKTVANIRKKNNPDISPSMKTHKLMGSEPERCSTKLSRLSINLEQLTESAVSAKPEKLSMSTKQIPAKAHVRKSKDSTKPVEQRIVATRTPDTRGNASSVYGQEAPLFGASQQSSFGEMVLPQVGRSPGKTPKMSSDSLNSAYTFDSYVVGSSNRFAHAAALAVAEQMAENYNPLFVYGGVGLGKTHLLHAIGNQLSVLNQGIRVLYLSAEQFINELVFSIREDRMRWFREKYRNIDLLLVDDIQFIARKERTQEEFFHTFNTLYQARKQIVLTSDCPPKKIPTIAEQLRSRFEWGLIADIQPPDLETRIAILKKKGDFQGIDLPDDVAIYIASQVKSNIRELEGCLSKIRAYSTFNQHQISLELTRKVLKDMFEAPAVRRVTVELVQRVVANHYQVTPSDLKSSTRNRKITLPRQIAMYLSREMTNLSLFDIGRGFGGRDHTTVMHACKKVERTQAQDVQLRENIIQIREIIRA